MQKIILSLFFLLVGVVQPIAQTVVLPGFPPGIFNNRLDNGCFGGSQVDLNFAASSYCGGTLNNLISTSRASNGYAQDLSGNLINFGNNVARITNQGLLIEEARTNVCQQSQTLDNGNWNKTGITVIGDTTIAPDGTTTADTITATAGSSTHNATAPVFTFTTTTVYTFSLYAKMGTYRYIQITGVSGDFGTSQWATFDLQTGTVANSTGGTATIVQVGLYYRLAFIATSTAGVSGVAFIYALTDGSNARLPTWTAAGSETVIAWGAQTETGSFPTSYIPTTAASATRAADVITLIGNAATAALSAKAGYFQTNFGPISANSARLLQYENNSATNEGLLFISTNTTVQGQNASGTGSGGATLGGGTNTATSPVKSAFGFDAASITAIANGGTKASGANAWDVSVATRAILGNRTAGDRPLNGYMQRFALSPTKGAFDGLTSP